MKRLREGTECTMTFLRKSNGARRFFVCLLALLCAAALLSGCGDKRNTVKSGQPAATHALSDGDDKASSRAADGKQPDGDTADQTDDVWLEFESAFGGIAVETDENGEPVSSFQDGTLRCKVTDSRFPDYRKLAKEARRVMGKSKSAAWLQRADMYFVTTDDGLYFVNGGSGRGIESTTQYVTDGGARMRINAIHTAACRKKYKLSRSAVDLVRTDGKWKLVSLRNAK